jgi:dipeptidyl aminopeptidase/acylaminoacyl peptidase
MTSDRFDAAALVALRRPSGLAVHPDGTTMVLALERLDEPGSKHVSDLWLLSTESAAPPERLTCGDSRDRAPRVLSDGTVLFLSDRPARAESTDERRTQVWALPPRGEPRTLTDEPLGVTAFRATDRTLVVLSDLLPDVPPDSLDAHRTAAADRKKHGPSRLHYVAQPARFWDHWLGPHVSHLIAFDLAPDLTLSARRDLLPSPGPRLFETELDLAPDGSFVALTLALTNPRDRIIDRPIALIDTRTGDLRTLGALTFVVHASPRIAPDGASLVATRYLRTPDGYGPRTLWRYDLATAEGRDLTPHWDRWPVPAAWRGPDIVVTAEDDGRTPIFLVDAETGAHRRFADGSFAEVAVASDALVALTSSMLTPPEPVRVTGLDLVPLASLSGAPPADEATVRYLHVAVEDRRVPTFIVEPTRPNGRTVLWIHGGPVAAWGDAWHGRWCARLMAAHGYRVVLPNPAGSTGLGLSWVNDVWGNTWGDRCYRDLMGVVEYLENQGIRPEDMVVMGGSFGGYMTNWIGTQTDRFRLLVAHASLFHMSAFHGVTDLPAWWQLMLGAVPWDPTADYDRYSPSRHVTRWKTPTLILHGERDYRVPIGEGLALFEALQALGVPSELVVFPDEHHWILKPRNVIAWYEAVLDFIDRNWRHWDSAHPGRT